MYLLLGVFLLIIFLCIDKGQKFTRKKGHELYQLNEENGEIEYLLSWYIFWNEVVPEVYKAGDWGNCAVPMSIYDVAFYRKGDELYGQSPACEAIVRAKRAMRPLGRDHYVSWTWDKNHWYPHEGTIADLKADPKTLCYHTRRSPEYSYFDPEHQYQISYKTKDGEDIVIVNLAERDRCRTRYLASDGKTWYHLKDSLSDRDTWYYVWEDKIKAQEEEQAIFKNNC